MLDYTLGIVVKQDATTVSKRQYSSNIGSSVGFMSSLDRINRRLFFVLGLIVAVATTGFSAERPNILFIFSDDHAINAISAYEGPLAEVAPTPNIDRIAKEGAVFLNSFCGNSICGPSRARHRIPGFQRLDSGLQHRHCIDWP